MEKRTIRTGNIEITYILTRKKVKNINMRVKADGNVYVSASNRVSVDYIDRFVASKAEFIMKAIVKMQLKQNKPLSYNDGEKCKVWGNPWQLKIIEDSRERVEYTDFVVTIFVKNIEDKAKVEKLYLKWQREQVEKLAQDISKRVYPIYKKFTTFPNMKIRLMKSLWGSCNRRTNTITLNLRLFEYNTKCLLYVLIHEYTHYIHPNHSKEFHKAVGSVMPDWKEYDNMLKQK